MGQAISTACTPTTCPTGYFWSGQQGGDGISYYVGAANCDAGDPNVYQEYVSYDPAKPLYWGSTWDGQGCIQVSPAWNLPSSCSDCSRKFETFNASGTVALCDAQTDTPRIATPWAAQGRKVLRDCGATGTTTYTLKLNEDYVLCGEGYQGTGTVTSTPSGINCPGGACSASYAAGTRVTLTATATPPSVFVGWSGACSGTGPCTVTMNASTTVGYKFLESSCATTSDAGAIYCMCMVYSSGAVCGDGVCSSGESCSTCARDCGVCSATCGGTAGQWAGCRGSGCSVCSEKLGSFPRYLTNHPACVANGTCAGQFYTCNASCPATKMSDGPCNSNGVCESGEDCTNCAKDCGVCGATCGGTTGQWAGCRGNGCAVCAEKLTNYTKYLVNHPACVVNNTCAGSFYTCNSNCPAPTSADQ
jgi:hypothetical protein